MSNSPLLLPILSLVLCLAGIPGCGTTRLTDTSRSASEEMLLSHAIDLAVARLDLDVLAGQTVFLNTDHLGDVSFSDYLTGALRQHLLASGARLVNDPEEAQLVVEARAGSVATTQHESLIGIPRTTVPAIVLGTSATVPEIAILKEMVHIGVAKVGVFAYRTDNGAGVWQSGMVEDQSVSQSNWYLGIGPFQTGDVVLDGNRARPGAMHSPKQLPPQRSPLQDERWIGELPPAKLLLPSPLPLPSPDAEREEDFKGTPEPADPGWQEPTSPFSEPWRVSRPVVVSPP